MTVPLERRIRVGAYEWRCTDCRAWYSRLAEHLREAHGWDHGPEPGRQFEGQHTARCRCPR